MVAMLGKSSKWEMYIKSLPKSLRRHTLPSLEYIHIYDKSSPILILLDKFGRVLPPLYAVVEVDFSTLYQRMFINMTNRCSFSVYLTNLAEYYHPSMQVRGMQLLYIMSEKVHHHDELSPILSIFRKFGCVLSPLYACDGHGISIHYVRECSLTL